MNNSVEIVDNDRNKLLVVLWKYRKFIGIACFIGLVIATVIAFLLTPLFKSTAIVFPAATSTVSFSEQRNAKASSMDFGEEEQAEQLVQILQSSRIRDKVINKYKLMEHYNIDADDSEKYDKLMKKYANHFNFQRTRFGSIEISVLDRDPKLAADMANNIVNWIDTVKNDMVRERTIPAFEINIRKKAMLEIETRRLSLLLDSFAMLGVVSIDARANLFTAYVESKTPDDRAEYKKRIDVNLQYGATFDGLENERMEKTTKLVEFEQAYEQAESDANTNFNHKFVVESAVVADKKDRPKRLVIMILATISTFFFAVFAVLIFERYKELKAIKAV